MEGPVLIIDTGMEEIGQNLVFIGSTKQRSKRQSHFLRKISS